MLMTIQVLIRQPGCYFHTCACSQCDFFQGSQKLLVLSVHQWAKTVKEDGDIYFGTQSIIFPSACYCMTASHFLSNPHSLAAVKTCWETRSRLWRSRCTSACRWEQLRKRTSSVLVVKQDTELLACLNFQGSALQEFVGLKFFLNLFRSFPRMTWRNWCYRWRNRSWCTRRRRSLLYKRPHRTKLRPTARPQHYRWNSFHL